MAKLSERQVKEMDIDWYCLVKGVPTHIASMGGSIPAKFRDRVKLRLMQSAVASMEPFTEVTLNNVNILGAVSKGYEYLQDEMIRNAIEVANRNHPGFEFLKGDPLPFRLFASTFVEKARRGFRSFARREDANGNEYVLIAEPAKRVDYTAGQLKLEELECEVREEGTTIVF